MDVEQPTLSKTAPHNCENCSVPVHFPTAETTLKMTTFHKQRGHATVSRFGKSDMTITRKKDHNTYFYFYHHHPYIDTCLSLFVSLSQPATSSQSNPRALTGLFLIYHNKKHFPFSIFHFPAWHIFHGQTSLSFSLPSITSQKVPPSQ